MDSVNLKENGFSVFLPLKGIQFKSLPTNQKSVLVLADCTIAGKPTSDILYIGKSKNLVRKVFGGYFAGYGGKTTQKIHTKLIEEGFMEKACISWMQSDNPNVSQKELLEKFKKEHGQYPAWNAKKSATTQATPKTVKASPLLKSAKNKP
jgi:hypothetical protein